MALGVAPIDVKPDTLGELAYERIYEAIVTRAIPPGERVTEAGLARQLGVSKTPAREALLRLREVGLIEPDGARGNRVLRSSAVALREAYEMREALEPHALRLAGGRLALPRLEALGGLAERSLACARDHDASAFRDCDRSFHREIATLAGNSRMALAIDNAMALIRALQERDLPDAEAFVEAAEAHLRVVDALTRSDSERAARELAEHIRWVESHILDPDSRPPSPPPAA